MKIQLRGQKNRGEWVKNDDKLPDFLNVRVIKIKLNTGEVCYLATNLDFDIHELGMLYYLRWGIETYYNYLKSKFKLEDFSEQMVVSILQDFYCKTLVANLAEVCITEAENLDSNKQKSRVSTASLEKETEGVKKSLQSKS